DHCSVPSTNGGVGRPSPNETPNGGVGRPLPNETNPQRKQSGSEGGQDQLCSIPVRGPGVRSGEPRISWRIHLLEPALDLSLKAVDRVLTRAPNERGNVTFAVDEKMERRVCEFGAKATERLGTGEVSRHSRMNLGQGRADSLRL